ncbi:MAG TPA: hypothetical protein PLQ54_01225 [Armatimonadota bacterium]|nr:hypothetical protein [Armatimonadota bacterium]
MKISVFLTEAAHVLQGLGRGEARFQVPDVDDVDKVKPVAMAGQVHRHPQCVARRRRAIGGNEDVHRAVEVLLAGGP